MARPLRVASRAARISDYIQKTLAAAPPLTDEQRNKLAELLRPVRIEIAAKARVELRGAA